MKKQKTNKGFTLIEIILTVGLLAIVTGIGLYYSQGTQIRNDIYAQAKYLTSNLRLAQSNASSGKTDKANAIHLENDSYTLFIGTSYTPSDPRNYTETLPPTIKIEDISLNGGGSNIIFSSPNGETENYGNLNLTATEINKSINITINNLGAINY